jgi:hypothetical protein
MIILIDIIGVFIAVYSTAKKLIGSFQYHYADYTSVSFAVTFSFQL